MSRFESILTLGCLGLTSVAAQAAPFSAESASASRWLIAATCSVLLLRAAFVWRKRQSQRKARL